MQIDYGWKGPTDFRRWGPYLSYGIHAESEMCIGWQSKFFALEEWLDYGDTPACGTRVGSKISPQSMHAIRLTGLKPDTTYYYKISRIEDLQQKPQPVYTFRTGPVEGSQVPIDFCIFGDLHATTEEGTQKTFQSIMTNVPNVPFIVTAGDCVTHGGNEECWNDFFHELIPYTSKFVMMNTTGNHDTDHPETYAHFVQTFHHPYENPALGAYYYFIYGNAVFIMLDSTNAGQVAATQGVVSDAQLEWLEKVLKQFATRNYWIFVVMHHPIYTTGDSGMIRWYEIAYKDLFEEYQVDAAFYGHDHAFEVYWAGRDMDYGGTHYMMIGNGGGPLGIFNRDVKRNPPYLWKGRTYVPARDGILGGNMRGMRNDEIIRDAFVYGIIEYGFTHFHIEGNNTTIKMVGRENQTYFQDHFTRTGCGKRYHTPDFIQEF